MTLTDSPDPVPATHRIHYQLAVLNEGQVPLSNVVVTDRWSPRDCVYYLPYNPDQLVWNVGTLEPGKRFIVEFNLETYSICGGRTVTNQANMTCDQGSVGAITYTHIGPTPVPTATASPTPTIPGATETPAETPTLTPTATPG